ncbi:MAG TPA: hypothetical protein VNG13_03085 [Mycobacteriales bacterium]|nr:hypothetical protein [Mycobacteriales bacterium]
MVLSVGAVRICPRAAIHVGESGRWSRAAGADPVWQGATHAVTAQGDTLCGQQVGDLVAIFDADWTRLHPFERCPACSRAAGLPDGSLPIPAQR